MAQDDTGAGADPGAAAPQLQGQAQADPAARGALAASLGRMRQARAAPRARGASGNGPLLAGLAFALLAGGATYVVSSATGEDDDTLAASRVEAFQSAAATGGRIAFPEDEPEPPPAAPPIVVEAAPAPRPAPAPVAVAARPDDALARDLEDLRRALRESEAARSRDAEARAEATRALREELSAAFDERLKAALAASEEAAREAQADAQETASALRTRNAELEAARAELKGVREQLTDSEADVLAAQQAEQARLDAEARRLEQDEAAADLRERQIASPSVVYAEGGVAPGGEAAATAAELGAPGAGPRLTASEAYLASAPPLVVAEARRLADPDRTIAQGTVIQAALQTAVSSELPGSVVAVVSEPVLAFSGDAVLIPRGSRLFGSYREGMQAGQRRVLVRWSRVLTPDGASLEISSVGGDGLGRSGLSGFVDTRFRERFGGAALVSLIGGAPKAAAAALGDGAGVGIVLDAGDAMGGAATSALDRQLAIPPTIHVPQGAAVTVIVDRDVVVR